MPKIFEYLGILIFFYSNEHEPIHVHGKHDGCESKAEFYIIDGLITLFFTRMLYLKKLIQESNENNRRIFKLSS